MATLTVIVLDAKSQPVEGASVSIVPANASAKTNNIGEVQFTLGNATKYDITASYSSNTVTVPYYVTQNGATRLVVNPTYVKAIEKQLHPSIFGDFGLIGIVILLGIVSFFAWKIFKRRQK